MTSFSPHDRPREKLDRFGASVLGDNELISAILGHGGGRESALEIANRVLVVSRGVHGLTRMTGRQLRLVSGLGPAKSAQIMAAVELGRRTLAPPPGERVLSAGPPDVASYLLPAYGSGSVERFGILLLDTKHRVIRTMVLSVGTLDASLVHPREVFRAATESQAAAVVVFHNHASGDPTPSREDTALTRRLVDAGLLMGIEVLEHLVLAMRRTTVSKRMAGSEQSHSSTRSCWSPRHSGQRACSSLADARHTRSTRLADHALC